ncbi:MAG: glycogen debranching enzyme family protein [Phycisphaerae bacterium]|nr:glycogen debranching enzyme family protein [Phycisphaerae bacterium]
MTHAAAMASLDKEWLLCNGRGGFASGTVCGMPTRRYHGLLCVAARPPLERWMLLNAVLEKVTLGKDVVELAAFEFERGVHPRGFERLTEFAYDLNPACSWARFEYQWAGVVITKWVIVRADEDAVEVRYAIVGPDDREVRFDLLPFASMRDFHALHREQRAMTLTAQSDGFRLVGPDAACPVLLVRAACFRGGSSPEPVTFEVGEDWWHGIAYRVERARGQDTHEDLFTPGWFHARGKGAFTVILHASAQTSSGERGSGTFSPVPPSDCGGVFCVPGPASDAAGSFGQKGARPRPSGAEPPSVAERLRQAAAQFVVARRTVRGQWSRTILAGYPWFGDWGRDTFIALPGLLLLDQRFDEAREVLRTFASAQCDGLIPNRFSDYGDGCDYNSVDASLWYVHAADAYVTASGDEDTWRSVLEPACCSVADAFVNGTRFGIRMDADGLVTAGDPTTQITWMDAKCGDVVFTPRHGKCVEINALWYHALRILAERSRDPDHFAELSHRVRRTYAATFWNEDRHCLYDCVHPVEADAAIRPNQIFAVSLAHSPLEPAQQAAVVECVRQHLLTRYGLRSLASTEPGYHGRFEGGPFERDSAYHQGTVWAWLIGPFVEAYLRVRGYSDEARTECRRVLAPLIGHLDDAGLGSVSEVFGGDPPHTPGGCFAQAWSVAELRRAVALVESH